MAALIFALCCIGKHEEPICEVGHADAAHIFILRFAKILKVDTHLKCPVDAKQPRKLYIVYRGREDRGCQSRDVGRKFLHKNSTGTTGITEFPSTYLNKAVHRCFIGYALSKVDELPVPEHLPLLVFVLDNVGWFNIAAERYIRSLVNLHLIQLAADINSVPSSCDRNYGSRRHHDPIRKRWSLPEWLLVGAFGRAAFALMFAGIAAFLFASLRGVSFGIRIIGYTGVSRLGMGSRLLIALVLILAALIATYHAALPSEASL